AELAFGQGVNNKHRAVGGPQVVADGLLHKRGRDLPKLSFEPVDAARVIIKQRERRQQVGPPKVVGTAELVVERAAQLHHRQVEGGLADAPFG
nr:hypothetical protein [Tanacetum cinerariifolium]